MKFKGDIIITDPCYLGIENEEKVLNGLFNSTIYGDWSCHTFEIKEESKDKSTKELTNKDMKGNTLGQFCADGGMVCVVSLEEVLKHNPKFDYHTERPWTTTLIKDFDGEAFIEINDKTVKVRGKGNVNFITAQTRF